eukprot:747824-Hanusia_phi.AAC.5
MSFFQDQDTRWASTDISAYCPDGVLSAREEDRNRHRNRETGRGRERGRGRACERGRSGRDVCVDHACQRSLGSECTAEALEQPKFQSQVKEHVDLFLKRRRQPAKSQPAS